MRILYVTDNFPPESNAGANRAGYHCAALADAGFLVDVLTGAPNFPRGKIFPGYRNSYYEKEDYKSCTVHRVWTFIAENKGRILRIIDYVSFFFSAVFWGFFLAKPKIVVGTSPQFFAALAAYVLAKIHRSYFVFEVRDLWPESIHGVGAIKSGTVLLPVQWLAKFLYSQANAVICVTQGQKRVLMTLGVAEQKIFVICNGSSLGEVRLDQEKLNQIQVGLRQDYSMLVGLFGTLGMAHEISDILKTIELLKNSPQIKFIMIGDGAQRSEVERFISEQRSTHLVYLGSKSYQEIAYYWKSIDLALISLKNTEVFSKVIPSKLYDAATMAVPVLASIPNGETQQLIEENNLGWVLVSASPEMLAKKIIAIYQSELKNFDHSRQKLFAEKSTRKAAVEQLISILKQL